ncbi:Flp pilus assembly protein TadB|uniref:Flp pilus assembly protein TadB n=1 Tax=Brenneria salicis ATCC 15712 = DSM 30166 TaxID=714314 RepID=A0A366I5Q3_9GAMM|nr:type II secretion system F family protein [Brenneria salicis]NMN92759.1 Flp pilus assembly protein TadB [Brenneria salicis ATCC 15712 = DSM 30166]RBP63736.1 Flp pilus assembly protein TadB [Brenneria salicis ATCC 15712 = DSM 30166]RLM31021.1 hypothetical protein BHG07_07405 [Brenneria salicis ATCC 15712 = DSM 30166]
MTFSDIILILTFAIFVLFGLAAMTLADVVQQRPTARIRQRLKTLVSISSHASRQKIVMELERAQAEVRRRHRRKAMGTLGYYLNRLETVGNRRSYQQLIALQGAILLAASALFYFGLIPVAWWSVTLLFVALPVILTLVIYRKLVERFKLSFLTQMPDAIDMITRASQAGIPITQSIRNVGNHFAAPLGPEFRRIGDGLLLGHDLQEVMDEAVLRIELPDFAFFAVCLSLQRSTGGSLTESLENLSTIIRNRRDLRLKTKAMTAESRLSGTILTSLPFLICGALFALSPDYINVLFYTAAGQQLLFLAATMLTLGVLMIRKIARMEI